MDLTLEQKMALERLYENESLTDNLTDQGAKALLEWAQQQIISNTKGEFVTAAVSAANASGEQGVQALLAQASTFLAQELSVSAMNTAPAQELSVSAMNTAPAQDSTAAIESSQDHSTRDTMREPSTEKMAPPQAGGEIGQARLLTARAEASIAPRQASPKIAAKKARRKAHKKKS